jgi:hypothetical protein
VIIVENRKVMFVIFFLDNMIQKNVIIDSSSFLSSKYIVCNIIQKVKYKKIVVMVFFGRK